MKILITGGAGFIGKNLLKENVSHEIYVIDNFDSLIHGNSTKLLENYLKKNCDGYLIDDYTSEAAFKYISELRPDVIVTMASQTGTSDGNNRQDYYINENIVKFSNFIDFISKISSVSKIIHLSTRAVYGNGLSKVGSSIIPNGYRRISDLNSGIFQFDWEKKYTGTYLQQQSSQPTFPISIYGGTKLNQESILYTYKSMCELDIVVLRLQNVIGRWQSKNNPYTGLTSWFVNSAASNEVINIYENGEIWRDFVDVRDVCYYINSAISSTILDNKTIDIGSGTPTNLFDYAKLIVNILDSKSDVLKIKNFRVGDVRWAAANVEEINSLVFLMNHSLESSILSYEEHKNDF